MRVLTWNLGGRYGPWQRRREAIAATLAEVDPDVCGLQEMWGTHGQNLAADLAERLRMHWCWAVAGQASAEHDDEPSIGNAILGRWPITTHAEVHLPSDDPGESRVALHGRIDTPGGALPMFTTHLTYRPGGSQLRLPQVRRLATDPGFTWDRRNGYQADSVLPDSRIDYILVGLPQQGRGRLLSKRLAGTTPVATSAYLSMTPSSSSRPRARAAAMTSATWSSAGAFQQAVEAAQVVAGRDGPGTDDPSALRA